MATVKVRIEPVDMERELGRHVEYGVMNKNVNPVYLGKRVMRDIKTDATSQAPFYFLNGLACYTQPVHEYNEAGEMVSTTYWIKQGSDLLHHASCGNLSVVELDFSPMGAVEYIPFSRCTVSNNLMLLPVSMQNKTVIMSIAGRLYFSDEIVKVDDLHIRLTANQLEMAQVFLLRNKQILGQKYTDSPTVLQNVNNILVDLWGVTYPINFVMLIDNPVLEIERIDQLYALGLHHVKFTGHVGGLLRSKTLKEVVGHVRSNYHAVQDRVPQIGNCNTTMSITPTKRFQIAHHDNFITDIGFMSTMYRSLRYDSRNYTDNQYELLNFFYYKDE